MSYIIIHDTDADGFCAAFVTHLALTRQGIENIELIGIRAGKGDSLDLDRVRYQPVIMVDLSFRMEEIAAEASSLLVIDHHVMDEETRRKAINCGVILVHDLEKSAAGLAFEHFGNFFHATDFDYNLEQLVNWVEDRDLWRFRYPQSKALNYYLRMVPQTIDDWTDMVHDLPEAIACSRTLSDFVESQVATSVKNGRWGYVPGPDGPVRCFAVNAPVNISEIGEAIYSGKTADPSVAERPLVIPKGTLAVMFFMLPSGKWVHSLRSNKVDCQAIAKYHGGGGHVPAAGFTSSKIEVTFD